MPISDGKSNLRKIAFQIGDTFFRFAINPENMTRPNPHRTTAIKTKSRIVIEDFQSDIPTITISGTTGFNPTGREEDRGVKKIRELEQFIRDYSSMGGNGRTSADDFYFHDFTNDESYVVHLSPEGITFTQDVSSPLLYRYEIKLVILRRASEPADEDIVDPEIGNRFPSISPGDGNLSPDLFKDDPLEAYDPSSGNPDVYGGGNSGVYIPPQDAEPINPQAPSPSAYAYGMSGLGYTIGYYARSIGGKMS